MKVLVTDGYNRAALAITRSLGRLGHEVIVGDTRTDGIAQASRYCRQRVAYPDPATAPDAFVDTIEKIARDMHVDVLLPVADITTFLVTGNRTRFACAVPCADAAVVERAANKVDVVATAERIGVPVPRSVVVERADDVPPVGHLGFPLVIKPWKSRIRTATGWASTSVSYADNAAALAADLARRASHEFPVLLQERLTGPGLGVFACYHDGRAVALFSHRRLRERPPWGGVSVLCASTAVDPAAAEFATRLLDTIGWQGVAMVEFKRDERDGVPKLMEINGRFWGSLQLAVDAGVDFPALLMQSVQGHPFAPQAPYAIDVRERWLWGDVDALLVSLFPGNNKTRLAGRSRARAIRDFLEFRAADLHYDNPKWDDAKPFLSETRTWFRHLVRGAAAVPATTRQVRPAARPPIRFASSFEDAGLDEAAWNELVAHGDTDSVFQTYQWARSWWATYAQDRSLLLVTASQDADVRALAPLVINHGKAGERVACFLGVGRADYSNVVSPTGETALVEAMIEELLASDRWDRLDLHNIPAQSESLPVIRRCCERAGFPVIADEDMVCPTLLLEGRDEATTILNKPSLRRRQNGFMRTGSLNVRHLTRAEDIEPLLDSFFDQHVQRWAQTSSPSLFMNPQNREFYRQLTRNLSSSNWLLFTVVEYDGHPIAFHYGFDRHGVVTWYKPSFDPAFASRSPGLTLLRYLIEHAVTNRRRELDFSLGDEAFKSRFTNHARRTVRLHVYRDSLRYNLARAHRSLRVAARAART